MFTDDDLENVKQGLKLHGADVFFASEVWEALIARLEASEEYKKAHQCSHREPHGATDVRQIGCQYDYAWRKAAGKAII